MKVKDFDLKTELPYLIKKDIAKIALIGSFENYNNAKVHISKDNLNIDAYCGDLAIQYCFVSTTGFQYDDTKLFTLSEIKLNDKVCKKCLKSLIKYLR